MPRTLTSALSLLALTPLTLGLFAGPLQALPNAHAKHPARKTPAHKSSPAHASSADAGIWKPDPKLLPQLQPEQAFGPYLMRIPLGYTVEDKDFSGQGGDATIFHFQGAKRPDGSTPEMIMVVATAVTGYVAKSVDALININMTENGLDQKTGFVGSETEDGQIGNLNASRKYFKFDQSGHTIHGFCYVSTDGHTNAQIIVMEQEPESTTFLPLAETMARTLRKMD